MDSPTSQQQQQQQLLSAATTPAGSANSSPSGAIIKKALAPKILLKKRDEPRARTIIEARTIFPSTEPKPKPDYSHFPVMVLAPENPIPIKRSTPEAEDAEIANNLPTIPYRKKDKYGNPYYRTWQPTAALGGYPDDDHVVVLVHFKPRGLETEETKPKSVYMNFTDYKKHLLNVKVKEMPLSARFGADYYFVEDERNYAKRVSAETLGAKPIGRKGHFETVWRTTYADMAGYDRFLASIDANLRKRQWADW
jgi:hypothetical protein